MKLDYGIKVAEELLGLLRPACEWGEVAGSIRRGCPTVNDVELVVVPSVVANPYGEKGDLFGGGKAAMLDLLKEKLGALRGEGLLTPRLSKTGAPAWGDKYVRAVWKNSTPVDIFIVRPPAQLGLIHFIRTGDADFAQSGLVRWKHVCPGGYSEEGALREADGRIVETPTEEKVFDVLNWDFVRPCHRTKTRLREIELPPVPAAPDGPVFVPEKVTPMFHACNRSGALVEVEAGVWRCTCTVCGHPYNGGLTA